VLSFDTADCGSGRKDLPPMLNIDKATTNKLYGCSCLTLIDPYHDLGISFCYPSFSYDIMMFNFLENRGKFTIFPDFEHKNFPIDLTRI